MIEIHNTSPVKFMFTKDQVIFCYWHYFQPYTIIRYSAHRNGYNMSKPNFKLDAQNNISGMEPNPDENEHNLNGMSYNYEDSSTNGLIVSNKPRHKTTTSTGVNTTNIGYA